MLRYKNFKLILPNEDQVKKIGEIIDAKNGSIFHDFSLNNIVKETFNSQLYYLVDNPLDIKSCAPVHLVKTKYGAKKYHFKPLYDIPYAGFVGNEKPELDKFSVNFFESLKYEGFPYTREIDLNTSNLEIGETCMVDLSIDEDQIFTTTIHSKRRNMIRKAIKSGIEVKKYKNVEGFKLFWPILKELHDKLGYDNLTSEYYEKIVNQFINTNQVFTLVAFKENIPISGIFIVGNNNFMHYYKGASLFNTKNEGQGELLQWEAIKLSKSLGVNYYDLCNLNKEKLPAIYKFKTGISNDIRNYPKYFKSNIGYKIMNRLDYA